jgi:chemotaxis protein histidine kinase CheA
MLLIEQLGQEAIIDAIWTIERINKIGYRSIELNEAIKKGLLSEGKSALLMEDLEKAKQELTASGQGSLQKIDKAAKYIEDLLAVVRAGDTSSNDIFAQLALSFEKAKNIVAELSALKLDGKIANIKSFFSEGGKIAAIMDALAQEMNILAGFVKMVSAAFAQTIRLIQGIPDGFKKTKQGKNKDVTLSQYMQEASGNGELSAFDGFKVYEIDAKEMESSLLDIMEDIKEKAGGGGMFSFKGMKNFFSSNAKSIGVGAFLGGLATLATGGLALGPLALAGAAGAGLGAIKGSKDRKPESPAKSYDTTMQELAEAIMKTKVAKLEGLLPGFVKAVKGTNPGEFAKYADEARKAIQTINIGFDVPDEINKFIKDYDGTYPQFKQLYDTDPDTLEMIISQLVGGGNFDSAVKDYDATTLAKPLQQFYKEVMGENSWHAGDLILEAGELAHNYTMSELLFEKTTKSSKDKAKASKKKYQKVRRNAKKDYGIQVQKVDDEKTTVAKAKKKIRNIEKAALSTTAVKANADRKRNIKNDADSFEKKVDKEDKENASGGAQEKENSSDKKGSEVSNADYKKYEEQMVAKGKAMFRAAERDPSKKDEFEKEVDKREKRLNKKMVSQQRKTNITKIADEFEKKIKAIDAEEKQETPEVEDEREETEDTQTSDTEDTQDTEEDTQDTQDTEEDTQDTEETVAGDVDFSLPEVPAFKALKGRIEKGKPLTDNQKKFISILYGDKLSDKAAESLGIKKEGASDSKGKSGGDNITTTLFGESYDRRLLSLAGIK